MKMKTLLSSLKEKKRYLVYEVISDKKVNTREAYNEILSNYSDFFGKFNIGKAGIMFLDEVNNCGIIKINNKCVDELRSSLTLVEYVKGERVIIKTRGVSGILKKAKEKFCN